MRIWCISDTHRKHEELVIPDCNLIIHSGDFADSPDKLENLVESKKFAEWFNSIDVPKILVPGNHDIAYSCGLFREFDESVTVLVDSSFVFDGINFYGSPWTPKFGSDRWVYNMARHKLNRVWNGIPESTDILITHGPPQGMLDITRDIDNNNYVQVGCSALAKRVKDLLITRHIFGHIHDEPKCYNSGYKSHLDTIYINASVCNRRCELVNHGYIIDI